MNSVAVPGGWLLWLVAVAGVVDVPVAVAVTLAVAMGEVVCVDVVWF